MSTILKLSNKEIIDLNLMCKMMSFTIGSCYSTSNNCVPSLYTSFNSNDINNIKDFNNKLMNKIIEEESDNLEVPKIEKTFIEELRYLINQYSKENGSDTPDFILSEYLNECLELFNKIINKREDWYGQKLNENL